MPLRSTERSSGRKRPRWKGGTHFTVKDRRALATTDAVNARNANGKIEHEPDLTRERRGAPKADAGLQIRSRRHGEVCLDILPYGKRFKRGSFPVRRRPIILFLSTCPGLSPRLVPSLPPRPGLIQGSRLWPLWYGTGAARSWANFPVSSRWIATTPRRREGMRFSVSRRSSKVRTAIPHRAASGFRLYGSSPLPTARGALASGRRTARNAARRSRRPVAEVRSMGTAKT